MKSRLLKACVRNLAIPSRAALTGYSRVGFGLSVPTNVLVVIDLDLSHEVDDLGLLDVFEVDVLLLDVWLSLVDLKNFDDLKKRPQNPRFSRKSAV